MTLYYNEITKKHYNSYDEAIAECKKEMEQQQALKVEIDRHNSQTREKMRDGSAATIAQASEYIDTELGLTLSTWHETWSKLPNWKN